MENSLEKLIQSGEEKGYRVDQNKDYGAGPIDVVWHINVHPLLPDITCGFVLLRADEGGSKDTEDNEFSLR